MIDFYSNDADPDLLAAQLLTFRAQQYKEIKLNEDTITTLNEIIELRRNPGYAGLLSEISQAIKNLCKCKAYIWKKYVEIAKSSAIKFLHK